MTANSDQSRHAVFGRPTLHHRIESQPTTPDRVTLYPEAAEETAQLTRWLTVDADCLVSLDGMR